MNQRNRIANKCHEYEAAHSSRDFAHGHSHRFSKAAAKSTRLLNRRAKRVENRMALKDQAF